MIIEHIKNIPGDEIGMVVDRSIQENAGLTITAKNINPCAIDLRHVSYVYDECDGVYLVWRNSLGGWSDHLFFKAYERTVKTKDLGEVQRYFSDRALAQENLAPLGYEAFEEWTLENKIAYESDLHKKEIESVLTSRQVYLYTGERYSGNAYFVLVKPKETSLKTKEKAIAFDDFEVTIQLPKLNTLLL